jgi:hypothetical protein
VGATATCTTGALTVGSHSFAATYSGDSNNAGSVSPVFVQRVLPASSTALVSSVTPSLIGQLVTFTATVRGTAPTGSVDFRDGATVLCKSVKAIAGKGDKATATCESPPLSVGSHSITATYSGDANNGGSVSPPLTQVVNVPPPQVNLTSSLNPSKPGDNVTFTAKVTAQAPTGTVTFKNGASALCNAVLLQGGGNSPTAACATSFAVAGSYSITAAYSGDPNNNPTTSTALTQTVKAKRH